jgi:hypothetical protein
MSLLTSEESALVGDIVFSKKRKEYSDLVSMFSQGRIDPTMTPLEFYNDPKNKAKYGKFKWHSFSSNWYFARTHDTRPLVPMGRGTHG